MDIRRIAGAAAVLVVASIGCGPAVQSPVAAGPAGRAAEVERVADDYFAGYLEFNSTAGTYLGLPGARHDRMEDNSLAALRRFETREDRWAEQLRRIDGASLLGTPAWSTHGILLETVEAARRGRVCRSELWRVSQLYGWQTSLPFLAQIQPIGTGELRDQALARWRDMPRYIDTETANLRAGLAAGYTVPRQNVEKVIGQIDALLALAVDSSPLLSPAVRDSSAAFTTGLRAVIADEIVPAMRRHRDFLSTEYLPRARTTIAISAIPNGAACYKALLRSFTTVDLDPDALHRTGHEQMAKIAAEVREIGQRALGVGEMAAVMERLRSDSQFTYRSREEVVQVAERALTRAKAEMPKWFGRLPVADVIVDPCLPFEEESGCPGSYSNAAADGSRPGRYRINTADPTSQSRAIGESTLFHETIPGHHLEVALAQERPGAHAVTRFFGTAAFSEGWALYSERLAAEMGLYGGDIDRLGLASSEALRAARLVVDPGIHALGWTRQQAIDYMTAHTAEARFYIESEVDRYIVGPGQATAYMTGRIEIERLRALARQRLGDRFEIKAFHDLVLADGSITLPMLAGKVQRWTAAGGTATVPPPGR